jgi:deoxyribodipyrimidine photo-lyase
MEILAGLPKVDRRIEFIEKSVAAPKRDLAGHERALQVRNGPARQEITGLAKTLGGQSVFCSRDYESHAQANPRKLARKNGTTI